MKIAGFSDDDIPWCGLFAAIVAHRARERPCRKIRFWARNWAKFGTARVKAGCARRCAGFQPSPVAVGHVGFYVAEDRTAFHVIGGNQGNRVSITRIAKARCIAVRGPEYNQAPGQRAAVPACGRRRAFRRAKHEGGKHDRRTHALRAGRDAGAGCACSA